MLFADAEHAGASVRGDQFLITSDGVVGALGGSRNLTSVEACSGGSGITVWALLDGIPIGPGEELGLDPFWVAAGDPGRMYSAFAALWGGLARARIATDSEPGWSSWYQYFGSPTPDAIRANLRLAAERDLRTVQIDDGYQRSIGEWLDVRAGWDPLSELSAEIERAGVRPGIWTAPFLVGERGPIASRHPEWLLRHKNGHPVRAHPGGKHWGGWALALDATHPAVLEHVREVAAALASQGFTYQKADFCYAAALPGRHHDPSATRAQALQRGLQAVRDGIGDESFLLACGCPRGPAVGVVDAMRVSPDTGPHWQPRPGEAPAGYEESAPCLANALRASLLRAPLHRRLWINDPDCLLLRPSITELVPWQRRLAADAVSGLGGFLMVSDDLDLYGSEEWSRLRQLMSLQPYADSPLELEDPFSDRLTVSSAATVLTVELPLGPNEPQWSLVDRIDQSRL